MQKVRSKAELRDLRYSTPETLRAFLLRSAMFIVECAIFGREVVSPYFSNEVSTVDISRKRLLRYNLNPKATNYPPW